MQPQIERPDYLNNHLLDKFQTIYLADVDRLDPPAVAALEKYAKGGGGIMFFVGGRTQPKFYNEHLYRDGESCRPCSLAARCSIVGRPLAKGSRYEPLDKGILSVFAGERNSYLAGVTVERYMLIPESGPRPRIRALKSSAAAAQWRPAGGEAKFDKGKVVALLTTGGADLEQLGA